MSYPHLLASIVKEVWAIEPRFAESYTLLVQALLNGLELDTPGEPAKVYARTPTGENVPDYDQAPKDSIAIVPLKGAMMKYDSLCEYGTQTVAGYITAAADHKNIKAILLDIDSGGGAMNAIPPVLDAIEYARSKKPVIAYADVAASAAYYIAVHCDKLILSNDISAQVGSIGVMISFADMQPYYEAQGVKFHKIYAPESNYKNKAFELALKGEYDLIKEEILSPAAKQFQQAVKANRPNLKLDEPGIIAGKMFYAKDALKYGMVDGIGTFAQALDIAAKTADKFKSNNQSPKKADMKNSLVASLLMILGFTELVSQEGFVALGEDDISKIKKAYKAKHKKELDLQGLNFEDGTAMLAEGTILDIEKMYNKEPEAITPPLVTEGTDRTAQLEAQVARLVEQGSQNTQLIAQLMQEIKSLSNQSDVIVIQNATPAHHGSKPGYVNGTGFEWDKAEANRPWNMRAIGMPVVEGSNSIDISQVISDLGAYSRQRRDEIVSFMRDNNIVSNLFPFISGVNDEMVFNSLFLGEFTQAFQDGWTPKGDFKIEPEVAKMYRIKIDHEFKELKAIELTWLSDLNKEGSNAYKMSFVGYLIREMLKKAAKEDSIAAINGVYVAPGAGVAGSYINKMNGLKKYLKTKVSESKIIPFSLGEWDATNILDWERSFVEMIPEQWKDMPGLALYASTRYMELRYARKKVLEGGMVNYDPEKSTIDNHENIRLMAVPHMGDSQMVFVTPIGNIRQLEFVPNEDAFLEVERSKRVLNVFCDYKRSIQALAVGKKWPGGATTDYEHQMIWMNDVDLPTTTFIAMVADDVTPSVLEHKSLVSVANTGATAITQIDDAVVGDIVRLKCGSATNAVTIAKAGNFADITAAWTPAVGDTITLYKRGATDWAELARTTVTTTASVIADGDATPSVTGNTKFITSANTGATAITNLDNAVAGTIYTLYGGSNTNASTIADSGNFELTAAMTLSLGAYIVLYTKAGGTFVELSRG